MKRALTEAVTSVQQHTPRSYEHEKHPIKGKVPPEFHGSAGLGDLRSMSKAMGNFRRASDLDIGMRYVWVYIYIYV